MSMQQMLREENYQLKNEITDLKNAFDLNRDILKILSSYNHRTDPQHNLLMQIITRLTTVNNQAMLNSLELIQEKNVLKQENLRLNLEVKQIEDKLAFEIDNNRICNQPNESKLLMQEQFNSLNRELLAANEERILKDQEIDYWKHKCITMQKEYGINPLEKNSSTFETTQKNSKIKRKYESNEAFKYEILLRESEREMKKLKSYIEELQNRLIILIKAFNINEQSLRPRQKVSIEQPFEIEREEVRLLKYALNDITVEKKEDEYILTITERFKGKDKMNNVYVKEKRSFSWPKNSPRLQDSDCESESEQKFNMEMKREESRISERQY